MKRLITAILLLSSAAVFGQSDVTRTNPVGSNPANTSTYNKSSVRDANLTAVKNLRIPVASSFTLNNAKDSLGYILYNTSIQKMGVYKGSGVWDTVSVGNGSLLNYYTKIQSDARYVPLARTITINGTTYDLSANRTYNVGTVTSIGATAGAGISVSGSPVTSSGSLTITNTLPDQTVVLNNGSGINVTGTYPNFTIANTSPSSGGTVTSVGATAGTGISVSGSPITSSGSLTITNTAPDQTVVLNNGTGISVTGTYPNFTITNAGGTVTSVSGTLPISVATGTTTPVVSIRDATTSQSGALTSTDWNTFNSKAPLASPTFTGVPTAPTATAGTSTTQLATTAFVISSASSSALETTLATTTAVTITINWQTDIVPGDTRTYAQKHGNAIGAITGTYDDSGVQRPYNPDWSYTLTGANINILTLTTLFTGKATII